MNNDNRDISIDILRGIAIFIMLGANVVGYVTPCENHPIWFDIYSSYAAPIFILIAGYMTAVNSYKKHTSLLYYAKRGGLLIITAAIIDTILWQQIPFVSFDVLYIIGIGIIVVFLLEKKPVWIKSCFVITVLVITAIMQKYLEYAEYPIEIELFSDQSDFSDLTCIGAFKGLLFDGWFPIFPWITFPILGSIMAHYRNKWNNSTANLKTFIPGIMLTVIGFVWLYLGYTSKTAENAFDLLIKREPYGEIFYPATIAYILTGIGIILFLFSFVDKTRNAVMWKPLIFFGRTALFNYILHTAIVAYFIYPFFEDNPKNLSAGWITYVLMVLICFVCSVAIQIIKKKIKTKNFFFNFYFGG